MGNGGVKLTKCDKVDWGKKNAIMQMTSFLRDPMFNLLFYCHIILHWEKWLLMKNLTTSQICMENFSVLRGSNSEPH